MPTLTERFARIAVNDLTTEQRAIYALAQSAMQGAEYFEHQAQRHGTQIDNDAEMARRYRAVAEAYLNSLDILLGTADWIRM